MYIYTQLYYFTYSLLNQEHVIDATISLPQQHDVYSQLVSESTEAVPNIELCAIYMCNITVLVFLVIIEC
jgi:hypothetical protein